MSSAKECKKCLVPKPESEFYRKGRDSTCKACRNAAHVIWQREKYKTDPEFKARSLANVKKWERKNPRKAADANRIRANRTLRRMRKALTEKYAAHSVAAWLGISRADVAPGVAKTQQERIRIYRELHRRKP